MSRPRVGPDAVRLRALYSSENCLRDVDPDHVNFIDLSCVGRIIAEEDVVIE
jgi:hypothetical protein